MPESQESRPESPSAAIPLPGSTKPKQRRCRNCDKRFTPTKDWQVFCCGPCRWEFHHHGGAYRQLLRYLETKIPSIVRRQLRQELERLHAEEPQLVNGRNTSK